MSEFYDLPNCSDLLLPGASPHTYITYLFIPILLFITLLLYFGLGASQ